MSNEWINYLKSHKGKGKTTKELSKMFCRYKVSQKISLNIKENKFKTREQAIAVSYSQVKKNSPKCSIVLTKQ